MEEASNVVCETVVESATFVLDDLGVDDDPARGVDESGTVPGGRPVVVLIKEGHVPTTHVLADSWKQAFAAHE